MQCSACRAVFSNGLDICPRCKTSLPQAMDKEMTDTLFEEIEAARAPLKDQAVLSAEAPITAASEPAPEEVVQPSRLVEFPGATRTANHPQWRKDLSERVRQIQERRARESARGATQTAQKRRIVPPTANATTEQAKGHPLGLIHSVETPPTNPLVIAALKRIERARQPVASSARPRSGGAAAAAARIIEEHYQPDVSLPLDPLIGSTLLVAEEEQISRDKVVPSVSSAPATSANASRALNLVVIAPKPEPQELKPQLPEVQVKPPQTKAPIERAPVDQVVVATESKALLDSPSAASARAPRRVFDGVVDDAMLARRESVTTVAAPEIERTTFEGSEDQASLGARVAGGIIDVLVVAFASSPFAAVIELTSGNWADVRVLASMGGIIAVIMFLYLSIATLLAGRTWGMSLVSVHPADVHTGLAPSTKQAVIRSLVYMISLVIGGLGMLYGLFDPEGRTVHDHLSGTVVLRD